ncbi:FAD-dependent oxidoreductase [Desulfurococcus mucosus]|uniref:Sulfide dehydrogenase (Flavoprotein) subunit SudA n=1 Tax=Desulfurococcus mucosus (strain ATCC 35584 / DSM 2162 / JCM 9187 / O7/1) TaxID=765177 RepID=E8RAH0_DESM0|nr:FAD-dependent oxidoreductase [Desulfurococcus mucosus]ADV64380.1 sulfide dehydrogenase (flavoprotein) subunit SudA [Desulfurococcus mucosus DSM 2162]
MNFAFMCKEKTGSTNIKVAVIGAGPAGLAAAGYLACQGYSVDVYDKLPHPGGLMVFAIPPWRIPRSRVLEGVRDLEKRLGVRFITRTKVYASPEPAHEEGDGFVEKTLSLEEIVGSYDLVLLSTGTWRSKIPRIPGSDAKGVESALEYVHGFRLYELGLAASKPFPGKRVVVVGGGYSAIDAAEQAVREGAEAYLVYRRTVKEAPAGLFEVERVKRLGVEFMELVSPVEIISENGAVKAVKLQRMQLGPPDETGRPQPIPVPGSEIVVEADRVVFATGETPTPPLPQSEEYMGRLGIKLKKDGSIVVNQIMQTGNPKVFAAGDVVHGPSKVGPAIRSGFYAARYMHNWIQVRLATARAR